MGSERLDVVGIGGAIVDVLAKCEDQFLTDHGIAKGAMTLIDQDRAKALYDSIGSAVEVSGGSAANTIAGLASFGAKVGFIGKVRDDQLGDIFRHDIRATGVEFTTDPATDGPPTARSFILISPDAERSMNTYLGASGGITRADIDQDMMRRAHVAYVEGYAWDTPDAKDAIREAAVSVRTDGGKLAFSLSDPFCVERHRDEFRQLVQGPVDVLFANEQELCALYQAGDVDAAINAMAEEVGVGVVTLGARGAVAVAGQMRWQVEAWPVDQVVDTTGAGDLFAAGFLFGLSRKQDHETNARLATIAAAEIISHVGARPETPLVDLARQWDVFGGLKV
ncbi:MAG: adenosine kinase [Alphaproteobacteria bacterium]